MPPKRPAKITIAHVRARVTRGPHKSGDGRWYWRAVTYADSAEHTLWTGWATRAEAEIEVAGLVAGGVERPAEPKVVELHTVGDLLTAWWAVHQQRTDLAPDSLRLRERSTRRLLGVHAIAGAPLEGLTKRHVSAYVTYRRQNDADSSIGGDLKVLGYAWSWGIDMGACTGKPPRVPLGDRGKRDKHTPSPGDVAALINHLDGWQRMAVIIMWATGCRLGELAKLTPASLDLEGEDPSILLVGKSGRRRVYIEQPIAEELRTWLGQRQADTSCLLGVSYATLANLNNKYIPRAAQAAGVLSWTTHGFRRAVVDSLARSGVDVATAAEILGHSPMVMLQNYRRVTDGDKREAVKRARLGFLPAGEVVQGQFRRSS